MVMKIIIAGSRNINKYEALYLCIRDTNLFHEDVSKLELVTGDCPTGPDQVPYLIQDIYSKDILVTKFPANWNKYSGAAGPIRNKQMAEYADKLILIWNGESRGSMNMKNEMLKLNKPIKEIIVT